MQLGPLFVALVCILITGASATSYSPPPPYGGSSPPPAYRSPPPPPSYPGAVTLTGYPRLLGPLSRDCEVSTISAIGVVQVPITQGRVTVQPQQFWSLVHIQSPLGLGIYGGASPPSPPPYGTYPRASGACTDTLTGLPIPFSLEARYPSVQQVLSAPANASRSFGVSATTSLCEGDEQQGVYLPAATLYSAVGATNLNGVQDGDVLALMKGSTLRAAQRVLVADVMTGAVLMLVGKLLTKMVPLFCVPAAGFGGRATPVVAANMDEQVGHVADAILRYSQATVSSTPPPPTYPTTPVYGSSTSSDAPQPFFSAVNSSAVFSVVQAAATAAGCAWTPLVTRVPGLQQAALAVSRAAAAIAVSAAAQAEELSTLPIQYVLMMARIFAAVQGGVLPLMDSLDLGQYATALAPLSTDNTTLLGYAAAANVGVGVALSSVVGLGGSSMVPASGANGVVYGAGSVSGCKIKFRGLLYLNNTNTSTDSSGSFLLSMAGPGIYEVPAGCSDNLLQIGTRYPVSAVLPSGVQTRMHLTPGVALASTLYLRSQASTPSLPLSTFADQVYDSLTGYRTGFEYLTRTGAAVPWQGSAVQAAAFATDQMMSALLASGCMFVSQALRVPRGTCADDLLVLLSSDLSVRRLLDPSKIQSILFGLYNITRSSRQQAATRRRLQTTFTDSEVQALLIDLAVAISASNTLLYNMLQSATQSISSGDPAGLNLNITAMMLQASKVSKVQQGALADAVTALGTAIASNSRTEAQTAAQTLVTRFTGTALEAAAASATVNSNELPAPCAGAAALSTACIARQLPSPSPPTSNGPPSSSDEDEKRTLALGLGLGLGLGIPIVGMLVVAAVLLTGRRHAQIITPMEKPGGPMPGVPLSPGAQPNYATAALPPWQQPVAMPQQHAMPPTPHGGVTPMQQGLMYPQPQPLQESIMATPTPTAAAVAAAAMATTPAFNPYQPPPTPGVPAMPPKPSPTMGVLAMPPGSPRADRQARQQMATAALLAGAVAQQHMVQSGASMSGGNGYHPANSGPLSPGLAPPSPWGPALGASPRMPGPSPLSPAGRHPALTGTMAAAMLPPSGLPPLRGGSYGNLQAANSHNGTRLPPLQTHTQSLSGSGRGSGNGTPLPSSPLGLLPPQGPTAGQHAGTSDSLPLRPSPLRPSALAEDSPTPQAHAPAVLDHGPGPGPSSLHAQQLSTAESGQQLHQNHHPTGPAPATAEVASEPLLEAHTVHDAGISGPPRPSLSIKVPEDQGPPAAQL